MGDLRFNLLPILRVEPSRFHLPDQATWSS